MFLFSVYPSPVYALAVTISFFCWLAFEIWVFARDRGMERKRGREGQWFIVALVIGITVGLNMPALAPVFDIRAHFAVFCVLGLVLIWAGILFRFWAIQTLGRFFSTRLVIQQGHELITTGPYKYLRNPSYTAALVTFIGFGLGIGNWFSAVVLFLTGLIAYIFRVRVEEKMLQEQFGQAFQDYKKRTWALIPFVW